MFREDGAALAVTERTFHAGAGTRAVFDLGVPAPYSGLTLHADRDAYFTRVSVDVADRPPAWRTVRDGVLVYRAGPSMPEATVTFAPAGARYVRVRVHDGRTAFPLHAVTPIGSEDASRLHGPHGGAGPARPAVTERGSPVLPWLVVWAFAGATFGLLSPAVRRLRERARPQGIRHRDGGEVGP